MTAEIIGGWSFPIDELLEQIRAEPARDDDLSEWITAHLKLRFCIRFLRAISDISHHDGVEVDPATGLVTAVRFKPEDIREAAKLGDVDQLRDAMVQMYGDEAAPYIKHPTRGTGKHYRARFMDDAEEDYYFIRDLLRRTYLGPDEKRFYKWHKDAIKVIAEFHDVNQDSLVNRIKK